MKIALATENLDVTRGGAERSVNEMALCLTDAGHQVTLVGPGPADELGDNGDTQIVALALTHRGGVSSWHGFERAVAEHLSRFDYDIVHSMAPIGCADVYQPRGGTMVQSALRHVDSYRNPLLRNFKKASRSCNRARAARIAAERDLCGNCSGPIIAALSDYVRSQFLDLYDVDPARIALIRNGVMTERFRNDQARSDGAQLKQLYDRPGKLALFVFAAENLRLKGLDPLIRAARWAVDHRADNQRDFRILVISSSDYHRYRRQAAGLGLDQRVIFMGPTQQMPAVLNLCDAVVLPSFNDACSRVVMEALAAGRPAITTRFNGASDFLKAGQYGIVLDSCDDVADLGRALLSLCDRAQQQTMAQAIEADRVFEQVSMRRHVDELVQLYQGLLDRHGDQRPTNDRPSHS